MKLYCLKDPGGKLCFYYLHKTKKEVKQDVDNHFYDTWEEAKYDGYTIVPVKLKEITT